jgi:mannose-6-phosphate isomerase-like protein (cupin superfamily)
MRPSLKNKWFLHPEMRRIYKPISRQKDKAKMYGKKALDPKTELAVMKDNDQLENVDEYWETLGSVLNDDNTIEMGETSIYRDENMIGDNTGSDTLFDICSIRESVRPAMRPEPQEMPRAKQAEKDIVGLRRKSLAATSPMSNVSIKELLPSSEMEASATAGFDYEIPDEAPGVQELGNTPIHDSPSASKKSRSAKPKKKDSLVPNIFSTRKRLQSIGGLGMRQSMQINENSRKSSQRHGVMTLRTGKGKDVAVTGIAELYKGRSVLEPLVTGGGIETGILFLNNGAYIEPGKASYNFSLFMISGTATVSIDEEEITIKRGSVCVVEKGAVYSVRNVSGAKCSILLTYCID